MIVRIARIAVPVGTAPLMKASRDGVVTPQRVARLAVSSRHVLAVIRAMHVHHGRHSVSRAPLLDSVKAVLPGKRTSVRRKTVRRVANSAGTPATRVHHAASLHRALRVAVAIRVRRAGSSVLALVRTALRLEARGGPVPSVPARKAVSVETAGRLRHVEGVNQVRVRPALVPNRLVVLAGTAAGIGALARADHRSASLTRLVVTVRHVLRLAQTAQLDLRLTPAARLVVRVREALPASPAPVSPGGNRSARLPEGRVLASLLARLTSSRTTPSRLESALRPGSIVRMKASQRDEPNAAERCVAAV